MVLARRRAEWERTAWLCHVIANSNPYRDGPPVTPAQCNPLEPDSGLGGTQTGIDCMDTSAIAAYHDALKIREARTR
jgi:hypothetical protein